MAISGPKSQRDQLMVLVAILALAGPGLFWYLRYNPRGAELTAIEAHVDTLEMRNRAAQARLASGTVDDLRKESEVYAANLELMRQLVPASNEVSILLDQVSIASRRAGLDVGEFQPLDVESGRDFDVYRYKLQLGGGYHAMAEFLTNVGSLNRIIIPVSVDMTASPAAPKTASGAVAGRTVTSQFELHTFVVHTQSRPSKP
jgi:Tfp pilus assembly protein PilO